MTSAEQIVELLKTKNLKISAAESCTGGMFISKLIDTFVPDHVEEDLGDGCDFECKNTHRIKRAGILTAIAIAVHNFPEGLGTFLVSSQAVPDTLIAVLVKVIVAFVASLFNVTDL